MHLDRMHSKKTEPRNPHFKLDCVSILESGGHCAPCRTSNRLKPKWLMSKSGLWESVTTVTFRSFSLMMLAMLLLMLMLSTMNLCFDICLDDDGNFHNEGHVDAGMSIMRIKTNTSMLVFVFLFYILSDHARVKLHCTFVYLWYLCMFSTLYVCRQGGRWLYILGGDHSCFEEHRSF